MCRDPHVTMNPTSRSRVPYQRSDYPIGHSRRRRHIQPSLRFVTFTLLEITSHLLPERLVGFPSLTSNLFTTFHLRNGTTRSQRRPTTSGSVSVSTDLATVLISIAALISVLSLKEIYQIHRHHLNHSLLRPLNHYWYAIRYTGNSPMLASAYQ